MDTGQMEMHVMTVTGMMETVAALSAKLKRALHALVATIHGGIFVWSLAQ